MSSKILDKSAAILGLTVYCDGVLIARDVKISLPSITNTTVDVSAMGTLSVPLAGIFDDMETSISLTGHDLLTSKMYEPRWHDLEIRSVQTDITKEGGEDRKAIKHKLLVYPKEIPMGDIEVGATTERESTFACRRYQQYINGKETMMIDRLQHLLRIDGVEYSSDIEGSL